MCSRARSSASTSIQRRCGSASFDSGSPSSSRATSTIPPPCCRLPNLDRNIRAGDALSGRAFGDDDVRFRGGAALGVCDNATRERAARERTRSRASSIAPSVSARCLRSTPISRRSRRAVAIWWSRAAAAICLANAITRRATNAARPTSLRQRGERVARAAQEESQAAARCRSRFPRISPTSRHAADLDSFSEIRRGFVFTTFPPSSAPRFGETMTSRDTRRGNPARVRPAPGADSLRRSTSPRCSSSVRRDCSAPGGGLSLLVPAKLWRSLAGGGVRWWIAAETRLRCVEDYSGAPAVFDAAVYPSFSSRSGRACRILRRT